jgi:two-component system, sporulation sensor kinase B
VIEIFKDILLNIFFIMLPIAFYQLIFKEKRSMYRNILTYFLFVIPIVLCMHFRINLVQNGFIYDMKMIPFILAAYYGGPISTILLYFTLISYRLLFGGIGVYNNFVAASTGLIIFSLTFRNSKH